MPQSNHRALRSNLGTLLILSGIVLLISGLAYFSYAAVAESRLADLEKVGVNNSSSRNSSLLPSWINKDPVPVDSLGYLPPPTRVTIPGLNIDYPVVESDINWSGGDLKWKVGHYFRSANPGQSGDIILFGHKSSYTGGEGSAFRNLYKIGLGDSIYLSTSNNWYRFIVQKVEIAGKNDTSVLSSSRESRLILITCEPDFVYSHRLVVFASPD